MKEFKGTKGEWTFKENTCQGIRMSYYIIAEEKNGWGKWIGDAKFPKLFDGTEEESLANAKLIAAAPELLKALELIMSNSNDHAIIRIASKAINKALD